MELLKKSLAEAIGTFVLVFCGCGTAAALGCNGSVPDSAYIATALAFGLSIVAMAYCIGNVSGCHVNPAVSIAMWIDKRLSTAEFGAYVGGQLAGSLLATLCLGYLLGSGCGFGANGLYNGDVIASLVIELILTFIFVMVVMGATDKIENSAVAGLSIGGGLTLVHLIGIHFTGTSVNPARSLFPALFAGGAALSSVWVFILAPLVGGALAAIIYRFLFPKKENVAE